MKKLFLFALISLLNFTYAQDSYNIIESEESKGKTRGSSYVGIDENGYIYTISMKTTYIVIGTLTKTYLKVINANSGQIHAEVQLEKSKALRNLGMEYLSLTFIDKKPTVICKKIKGDKPYKYYGIEIDENGQFIGNTFEIGISGDCSGFGRRGRSYYSGVSQFKNEKGEATFISDITCRKDELKTYRVLELDKNLEIENNYTFKLDFESVSNFSYERGDKYAFIKVDTKDREKVDGKLFKRWITDHRLYKVDTRDGALQEIEVSSLLEPLKIGDFRLKHVDEGLLISGQVIQEQGFAGLFTAILNTKSDEIIDIKTEDFDIDFVTKYWSDREKQKEERRRDRKGENEDDENFSTQFRLIETFKTTDEGLISIFQEYELRVVRHSSTDANGVTTVTYDYYHYYKDVIAVKTSAKGNIEYLKLLPFYQLTINYNPGKGYSAVQHKNDLYFLHGTSNEINDMIEEGKKSNKRTRWKDRRIEYASITHIDPSGNVDTEQVLDLGEKNVSIDPGNVAEDKRNKQFVIVSPVMKMFNYKKTKVIRIEL